MRKPGMLSLLQDKGRFGKHRIGLATGGPLDPAAMRWANRLVHNNPDACCIEASFGGIELEATTDTLISVCGGDSPLAINGTESETWRSHRLSAGDTLALGFSQRFCRSYIAVAGGFDVKDEFGSASTVVREGIGGLSEGKKLAGGDELPVGVPSAEQCLLLPDECRPQYSDSICLRVIPGYQIDAFSSLQQRRFFSSDYVVTDRADRMGYRLEGPAIESELEGILSEGICIGAIQVPADGQPIVLLQDRQTIGGYPKIGAALSMDTAALAQLMPGARVRFEAISTADAHNLMLLQHSKESRIALETIDG